MSKSIQLKHWQEGRLILRIEIIDRLNTKASGENQSLSGVNFDPVHKKST
ncbi:Uncharacterised protein [Serratia fonticola]|uniref:Uncharacterized protein n=1 Tax=Serratia fonticola TaxID=47917 RepID=A0A4U9TA90_SERFO|nr:Uncharacterised protein [Serratia fonticola]